MITKLAITLLVIAFLTVALYATWHKDKHKTKTRYSHITSGSEFAVIGDQVLKNIPDGRHESLGLKDPHKHH